HQLHLGVGCVLLIDLLEEQRGRRVWAGRCQLGESTAPHSQCRRPLIFGATSSRCSLSPGRRPRRRNSCANTGPNLRAHWPIVSYVTATPRSARSSSTSRKLSENRRYSQTA